MQERAFSHECIIQRHAKLNGKKPTQTCLTSSHSSQCPVPRGKAKNDTQFGWKLHSFFIIKKTIHGSSACENTVIRPIHQCPFINLLWYSDWMILFFVCLKYSSINVHIFLTLHLLNDEMLVSKSRGMISCQ